MQKFYNTLFYAVPNIYHMLLQFIDISNTQDW